MTADTPVGRHTIVAVIPLYNGRDFIEGSLSSVLAQTRQADEIIVVDDGSTDEGVEVARRVGEGVVRFKILTQSNAGQSAARNHAVRASQADLIAFLDQDDWWYPGHLDELERAYASDRSHRLGWVYSDLDEYDRGGRMVVSSLLSRLGGEHPKTSVHSCLGADMFVLPSAALIAREAFERVGGFDERLSGYEDDDLFLRIFRAGYTNQFLPRSLSGWRIHSGSASYSPRMARSALIYAEKLMAEFPDEIARRRHFTRDLLVPRFLPIALRHYTRALAAGWRDDTDAALRVLDAMRPHIASRRHRILLSLARPIMGSYPLARSLERLGFHQLASAFF